MAEQVVPRALIAGWWLFVVRGVLAILFGLGALVWPGLTVLVLVVLFGAYAAVDGVAAIVSALRHEGGIRWPLLVWGLLGVAAGVVVFVWPAITALALVLVIGGWAIVTGVVEIAAAIALRNQIAREWALGLAGVLSVVVGGLLLAFPGAGALSLAWLIGAYAIVLGGMLVVIGLRLREA